MSSLLRNMRRMNSKWFRHIIKTACQAMCALLLINCAQALLVTKGFHSSFVAQANIFAEEPTHTDSLWTQLQENFRLPANIENNPSVQKQIDWYIRHKYYVTKMAQHAAPYLYYIYQQVQERKLPAILVIMPFIESAYNPCVYSDVGAAGLWQLMPGTGTGFGLKQDWWYDGRRDIIASTDAALDYLTYLNNFFNGNWILAIAAYDAGEGTVEAAIRKNEREGKSTTFWDLDLPEETQLYVPRIIALATIIGNPARYPVKLPPIKNSPYLAEVDVGSQIDLANAARMAGISIQELYRLNPGYRRWATDPNGPYRLLIPIEHVSEFESNLSKLPKEDRVSWRRYTVVPGDTLDSIAHKYNIKVSLLQSVNKIHNNIIHTGETLLIPETAGTIPALPGNPNQYCLDFKKAPNVGPVETIYSVKRGDSLWSIAKKFHLKPSEVIYWNHITSDRDLTPGLKLTLWTTNNQPHQGIYHLHGHHYTVQAGDTLSQIAEHFHVSTNLLMQVNGIADDDLHVGDVIMIPRSQKHHATHVVKAKRPIHHATSSKPITSSGQPQKGTVYHLTYTVRKGDTLSHIANYFQVKVSDIRQWNHLAIAKPIRAGEELTIITQHPPA